MPTYIRRDAVRADLPRIVDIYNCAVLTRESTCDTDPITVSSREAWFAAQTGSRRPIWVAEDLHDSGRLVLGYLAFAYFMNERPGYYITADVAVYLHPGAQGKGLGAYLLDEAIGHAPALGIEVLAVTIFSSNDHSLRLFRSRGFEQWGFMPRVARLGDIERDLVMMGRRI
jgi:L-amino acid N-acyltransferase YncA